MADILGAIFGTSGRTDQETKPDAIQQAMNLERLKQVLNLFATQGEIYQFGAPNAQISTMTPESRTLLDTLLRETRRPIDYSNIPTIGQYRAGFAPVTQAYQAGLQGLEDITQRGTQQAYQDFLLGRGTVDVDLANALNRSYADYGSGIWRSTTAYNNEMQNLDAAYNEAIARGDYNLARNISQAYQDYARSRDVTEAYRQGVSGENRANINNVLALEGFNRQRALDLGLDTTGNYISQIAVPRINQAMTLQGLEYGGAVPAAIARATAETAMPYLQAIEQTYGTAVANALAQYMAAQSELGQAAMGTQANLAGQLTQTNAGFGTQAAANAAQLGGQLIGARASAGNQYQQNVTQLAQAMMANNVTLEQAGIAADSALGQQLIQAQNALRLQQQQGIVGLTNAYVPQASAFAQSIPQAASTLSLLPLQMQGARAATAAAAAPLADFPRALAEADYLRRQGLFQTVYTGIPFSPGTTTTQTNQTGNLFNQLGSFLTSFTTSGTKGGTGTGLTG